MRAAQRTGRPFFILALRQIVAVDQSTTAATLTDLGFNVRAVTTANLQMVRRLDLKRVGPQFSPTPYFIIV